MNPWTILAWVASVVGSTVLVMLGVLFVAAIIRGIKNYFDKDDDADDDLHIFKG